MPITSIMGRRSWSQRLFIGTIYAALTIFGATMAIPFLITLTSSTTNPYDYDRFSIVPRSLWSDEDRLMKTLPIFIDDYPGWHEVVRYHLDGAPGRWTSWRTIGLDEPNVSRLLRPYLDATPEEHEKRKIRAADYAEFALGYPLEDCRVTVTKEKASRFMAMHYGKAWETEHPGASETQREDGALTLVAREWKLPVESYLAINFEGETRFPMAQQSFAPPPSPKYRDYLQLSHAVRHGFGQPGVLPAWKDFLRGKGVNDAEVERLSPLPSDATADERALWLAFAKEKAPASPVVPISLKLHWLEYLSSDAARNILALPKGTFFDVETYNRLAGTHYGSLAQTPFPLPAAGFDAIRPVWEHFITERYPLRLVTIEVTPEQQERYEQFLAERYKTVESFNRLVSGNYTAWSEVRLSPAMPHNPEGTKAGPREVWMDFVKSLPAGERGIQSSESAFQDFLRSKYGTVDAVNRVYGWKLASLEEARVPFVDAWVETWQRNQTAFALAPLFDNYGTIMRFLMRQGNAIPVTLWLIILSIAATLTINPIAAYALSRFNLKGKDKIILFCLATAAFPAMVSAIPGYLLMRDLGLLNTFFALVLPGAANGMAIFILKGFYDSLPQELFEAATIDGAKEWQIFLFVTLPMVKPIMAINALNAFMHAYSSWEWALIICQKKSMWTLSVWLYQASQWWTNEPWITTAGFVIASIPTLLVFLFCQKIIMRGIIVPSMK